MCVQIIRMSLMLFCKAAINPKAPVKQKINLSGGAKRRKLWLYNVILMVGHTEVSLSPSQCHLPPCVQTNIHECTHIYTHFLIPTLSALALSSLLVAL